MTTKLHKHCQQNDKHLHSRSLESFSTLAGGDIANAGIGELDRETFTQGALDHDEQLRSIEDPTLYCKV
ncbi:predicted protein [Lichtheimia corymbifera JMRC:FSU:9682]|uniref:Uncharacterized protein n=1 Tax=Lichtheimia corymbifera JMRC:FSU:9682 TaxID=1263082 RepID=A0A068S6F2_9FUNG|nr:predicted protein [Lichtheimia corymbifera JMRC:FSU:9682]